jgi:hypothetical protein
MELVEKVGCTRINYHGASRRVVQDQAWKMGIWEKNSDDWTRPEMTGAKWTAENSGKDDIKLTLPDPIRKRRSHREQILGTLRVWGMSWKVDC